MSALFGRNMWKTKWLLQSKGGSMHMYGDNLYGGNAIIGDQVPLGAGIAFAAKYKGTDGVCVSLYGDGAANQGQVFEVYNMAKLWDLPCIFFCENNGYALGTATARAAAEPIFYTRGNFVPGIWVDGMDVLAVRECFRYAVNYCRSGRGPLLIEAAAYRYAGHSMSYPGTSYRNRDEIREVRQSMDPNISFKDKIISTNLVTEEEIKKIDVEISSEIEEEIKKCKADTEIGLDEPSADVYAGPIDPLIRNIDPFKPLTHKNLNKAINL